MTTTTSGDSGAAVGWLGRATSSRAPGLSAGARALVVQLSGATRCPRAEGEVCADQYAPRVGLGAGGQRGTRAGTRPRRRPTQFRAHARVPEAPGSSPGERALGAGVLTRRSGHRRGSGRAGRGVLASPGASVRTEHARGQRTQGEL